ncbi:MAG: hypothetical protein ABI175_01180 [Polyangiales bacterium]
MELLMRASMFAIAVLGACTPDIVAGAYLCGPDESCPDGQKCDPASAICVAPSSVKPFACGEDQTEVEPNNSQASAQVIQALGCASTLAEVRGCTPAGDADDWFTFDVPATCTTTVAHIRLSSSVALQTLGVTLSGPSGSFQATETACDSSFPDDAEVQVCLSQALTPGTYAVRVAPAGGGNCEGNCAYNRYTLGLQLGTR